jgi:hypothetical protein
MKTSATRAQSRSIAATKYDRYGSMRIIRLNAAGQWRQDNGVQHGTDTKSCRPLHPPCWPNPRCTPS